MQQHDCDFPQPGNVIVRLNVRYMYLQPSFSIKLTQPCIYSEQPFSSYFIVHYYLRMHSLEDLQFSGWDSHQPSEHQIGWSYSHSCTLYGTYTHYGTSCTLLMTYTCRHISKLQAGSLFNVGKPGVFSNAIGSGKFLPSI